MLPPVGARISRVKFAILLLSTLTIVVLIHVLSNPFSKNQPKCPLKNSNVNSLVPNRVHFVHFDSPSLPFVSFVCILAAHSSQRPDKIVLHTNLPVDEIAADARVSKIIGALGSSFEIARAAKPTHVFGQAIGNVYHSNDVFKIQLALREGGIYLDQDTFLVRDLATLRTNEVTLGWPLGQNIGIQLILAKPDSAFMKLWLQSYRDYRPTLWYYNAGEVPTQQILNRCPDLVHAVPELFGVQNLAEELYVRNDWEEWREQYAIHLLFRHRDYLAKEDVKESGIANFDEENILRYNKTFGIMARTVLVEYGFI